MAFRTQSQSPSLQELCREAELLRNDRGIRKSPGLRYSGKELRQISEEVIWEKYFDTFNFYFSKPINEILADVATPQTILFKDLQRLDDDREFFKRYYTIEEYPGKFVGLSDFYHSQNVAAKPNLSIHDQNKIILKRNLRLHKLYVNRLGAFKDIPQTARGYSPLWRKKERELMSSYEESNEPENNNENAGGDNEAPRRSFGEMLNKQDSNPSIGTRLHDIYNPGDSSIASENDPANPTRARNPRAKNNILTEEVLAPNLKQDYLESDLNNINEKSITLNFSQGRLDHSNYSRLEVDESGYMIFQDLIDEREAPNSSKKLLEAGSSEKERLKKNTVKGTAPMRRDQLKESQRPGAGKNPVVLKGQEQRQEQLQKDKNVDSKKAIQPLKAESAKLVGPLRGDDEVLPKSFVETEASRREKAKLPASNLQKNSNLETIQPLDKKAGFNIGIKTKHQPQQSSPEANYQVSSQPTASHDTISSFHANLSSPSGGTKITHSVTSSDTGNNFSGGDNIQKLAGGPHQRESDGFDGLKNNLFTGKNVYPQRVQLTDRQSTLKKIYQEHHPHAKLNQKNLPTAKTIQKPRTKDVIQDLTSSPRYLASKLTKTSGLVSPAGKPVGSLGGLKSVKEISTPNNPGELSARGYTNEHRAISPSNDLKDTIITVNTTMSLKSRKDSQPSPRSIPGHLAKPKQLTTPRNETDSLGETNRIKTHSAANVHNFIIDQTKSPRNKQSLVSIPSERNLHVLSGPQKTVTAKGTAALEQKSASAAQKKIDLKLNLTKLNQARPLSSTPKEYGFYTDRSQKSVHDLAYQVQQSVSNQRAHEQNYFVNNSPRQTPQAKKFEFQRFKNGPKQLNSNFGTKSNPDLDLKATDFSSSSFKGVINPPSERVKTDALDDRQPLIKNFYQEINEKVKLLKQISTKKK